MKSLLTCCFLLFVHMTIAQNAFDDMTNEKIQKILYREAQDVKGQLGAWQFTYQELMTMILTDENANRMRIMSPIIEEKDIKQEQYKLMLEANFDRALDAKYAVFDGVVWSVFTHPLAELEVEQFKDALDQVITLSKTFGTTYNSTDFVFGGGN
ncbi:MAG: hypothetical protein R8G66_04825 [Cytophagales bacterium]|nr:hypothetical protein [Cytophagales bacterium]